MELGQEEMATGKPAARLWARGCACGSPALWDRERDAPVCLTCGQPWFAAGREEVA